MKNLNSGLVNKCWFFIVTGTAERSGNKRLTQASTVEPNLSGPHLSRFLVNQTMEMPALLEK